MHRPCQGRGFGRGPPDGVMVAIGQAPVLSSGRHGMARNSAVLTIAYKWGYRFDRGRCHHAQSQTTGSGHDGGVCTHQHTLEQQAGFKAQVRDLNAAGCERIFQEQTSSAGQRPQLAEALRFVRDGDTLVVTKPDRLARSTRHLLDIVDDLDRRGISLIVQSMGGGKIDRKSAMGELMLTMLAAMAQFERAPSRAAGAKAAQPEALHPLNGMPSRKPAGHH